jgi:hypothetical protein
MIMLKKVFVLLLGMLFCASGETVKPENMNISGSKEEKTVLQIVILLDRSMQTYRIQLLENSTVIFTRGLESLESFDYLEAEDIFEEIWQEERIALTEKQMQKFMRRLDDLEPYLGKQGWFYEGAFGVARILFHYKGGVYFGFDADKTIAPPARKLLDDLLTLCPFEIDWASADPVAPIVEFGDDAER